MSMVEVVAKAICEADRGRITENELDRCRDLARAAIQAMMEPTDEMVAVGGFEALEASMAERRHYAEIKARLGGLPAYESQVQRHAWKAMITAALKEG